MIYCIYLTENPYAKLVDCLGRELDSPGCHLEFIGYYESYEEAVEVMHNKLFDENYEEGMNGGFIANREPGRTGGCCVPNNRTFFLWDPEKEGFYEATEPEIFKYIAI